MNMNFDILIAEDDPGIIRLIEKRLKSEGYSVRSAKTGKQTLEEIAKKKPSLMLLDLMLPDMNSQQIIDILKEQGLTIPFMIMTGHGSEKTAVNMMKLGAYDYLVKDTNFLNFLPTTIHNAYQHIILKQKLKDSEYALLESGKRYLNLFENTPDAIYFTDLEGNYIDFNNAMINMFGYSESEFSNIKSDFLYADQEEKKKLRKTLLELGLVKDYQLELKKKNGDTLTCLMKANVRKSKEGKIIGYQGILRDITRRIETEKALKISEERHRLVSQMISDYAYYATVDDNMLPQIVWITGAFESITGYCYDEMNLLENGWSSLVHPDDLDGIIKKSRDILTKDELINEYRIITKSGEVKYIRDFVKPITENNNVIAILGASQDITRQKQAETALLESEAKFRTISEQSLMGLAIVQDNRIIYTNKAFENFSGYTKEEILDMKPGNFLKMVHPEDREFVAEQYQKKMASDSSALNHYSYRGLRKNEDVIWIDHYSKPILYAGKPSILITCIDITDRKEAEDQINRLNDELEKRVQERTAQLEDTLEELRYENEERKRAQDELYKAKEELAISLKAEKELNQMKTKFISMVSHEYRTPLTVILTTTYLLEEYFNIRDKENFQNNLKKIQLSVNNMNDLLEEILIIGKSEIGKLRYKETRFEIISFVQSIIEELQIVDHEKHHIEFKSNVRRYDIFSDRKLTQQIISNLLSNALKYSDQGNQVRIDLFINETTLDIKVMDQGIGIPEEDQKYLFEAFHRSSNVDNKKGSGLGLVIVKKCVDTMKGKIKVDSKVGRGTTIRVELPYRKVQ